ncbi:MAG: bifunctional alpha,alpha-trehalose-phosphate synthase (UDP-forming)/trehalose-phosphatase [Bacteroides sp.]|jgi:trehalose 6-phosphate synthase/phosphatase|nr:bifunctional alpha,alpha-trehalose-phosphate synthase (UDP-forming)/trehalose-phosphatase [Bacteroides sp.]
MRLLIVSNRLPVALSQENGKFHFEKSAGGLVSGLSDFLKGLGKDEKEITDSIWMGWPGMTIEEGDQAKVRSTVEEKYNASPVFLSQKLMDKVYLGFCNKTIWPLFHYFPNYASFEREYWNEYIRSNEIFCEEILKVLRPDDIVWVHDYHLMLLPAMLRKRVNNPIGFFLHIPFPSFEMYRLFPKESRTEILRGLLGSDLIGFHTHDYTQYFLRAVLRILGMENHMGTINLPDRVVRVATFPMGIEFDKFHNMDVSPFPSEKPGPGEPRVILSVDRLDYSKGLVNRLQGFELFLRQNPEWHGKVFLNMIVVPSRTGVTSYQKIKRRLDELVGNINGNYGKFDWTPIIYQFTSLPHKELIAQYRLSDVSLITPLRDGMNLVAKEYVASLRDKLGVLVLSEFTGAAKELGESIIINPNNIYEIADGIAEALNIPEEEQIRRNDIMQKRLKRYNVTKWAYDFVESLLKTSRISNYTSEARLLKTDLKDQLLKEYQQAKNRLIIVNYDGTLVPIHSNLKKAKPGPELIELLTNLNRTEKTDIVIISGRGKEDLDAWLGDTPVNLTAEHGCWIREALQGDWELFKPLSNEWKAEVIPILEMYTDRLPGAYMEERDYSISWYYHKADIEQAAFLSKEVSDHLLSITTNIGVQVLTGHRVIEVSNSGINKGELAMHWLSRKPYDFVMAMGAGWSDEMLFQSLPVHAWSIRVGMLSTIAKNVLKNQADALELLKLLEKH